MGAITSGWQSMLQLAAVVGIVVVALSLMVDAVKLRDAVKHVGALLGIAIALFLLPGIIASTWSGLRLWQKFGIITLAVACWCFSQSQPHTKNKHRE